MELKILIVYYNLKDSWTYEDLLERANGELPFPFKEFPGLLFKTFINNRKKNLYGGIYLTESQKVLDNYLISDLFKTVKYHPHFMNVTAQEFDIFEQPTRVMMDFFTSDVFKSIMQQAEDK